MDDFRLEPGLDHVRADHSKEKLRHSKRRHRRGVMVAKARKVCKHSWGYKDDENIEHAAVRSADNLKRCSCWMCRNPRRTFKGKEKITMQERVQKEREDE